MSQQYYFHTLSCGLRIVHQPSLSKVAYCGLAVNAGSRDEGADLQGVAHFVEHTIFKGTTHRKSWHILNRMERIGGELNAYTSKEDTFVYSVFPAQYYLRAIELISDLIQNSVFPAAELEKEREVVLDEVDSYRDSPSEAIYDDFEDYIFAGSGLGHNILGTEKSLSNISTDNCIDFLKNLYVPDNMVFFSYGDIKFERLCRMVEKYFGAMNHSVKRLARINPLNTAKFEKIQTIESHQSHTIYGVKTFDMFDNRKYAMAILNNMLAGPGMNSILNIALREKRGYVYTVESASTLFTDCGLFTVYFGCDNNHVNPCLKLISSCIEKIADSLLSEKTVNMAKQQYLGQLLISSDNRENVALGMGKSVLNFNKINSQEEITDSINSVTTRQIQEVASLITRDKASILTFG